jgi:hypothetical protein
MRAILLGLAFLLIPVVTTVNARVLDWAQSVHPLQYIVYSAYSTRCTAFHINEDMGYWLTAAHCVDYNFPMYVSNSRAHAYMVDLEKDLAIIRVPGLKTKALSLSKDSPELGDLVFMIGFPFRRLDHYITSGSVASHDTILSPKERSYMVYRAACSGGSSGSPVLNLQGQVVSVAQARIIYEDDVPNYSLTCAGATYSQLVDFAQPYFIERPT